MYLGIKTHSYIVELERSPPHGRECLVPSRVWHECVLRFAGRPLSRTFPRGTAGQSATRLRARAPVAGRFCTKADCVTFSDATWLSTNFGIIVCIECSGIHRDLGVHISRIQSLTLDNVGTAQLLLARHMTNQAFNEVMEATLRHNLKPSPTSTM